MNGKLRAVLNLVLLVIFIPSAILLASRMIDNQKGRQSYQQALELAQQPKAEADIAQQSQAAAQSGEAQSLPAVSDDDPNAAWLRGINLDALREINPDVTAWIMIPDSPINYPVLRTSDNLYYLDHTWDGEKNTVGAVFMEYQNSQDFSDYNTIIYGHNMGSTGDMFNAVSLYRDIEYFREHPHVYIVSDDGVFRYDVFASYATHVDSDSFGMVMNWARTRREFLDFTAGQSDYDTGISPGLEDRILTLATCYTYEERTRWVIHARLDMPED